MATSAKRSKPKAPKKRTATKGKVKSSKRKTASGSGVAGSQLGAWPGWASFRR